MFGHPKPRMPQFFFLIFFLHSNNHILSSIIGPQDVFSLTMFEINFIKV